MSEGLLKFGRAQTHFLTLAARDLYLFIRNELIGQLEDFYRTSDKMTAE